MSESQTQHKIRALLNDPDAPTRVWRNNVGEYKIGNRYIKYGLAKGSADLIGIHRVLITPEMVGTFIGKFLSAEIKSEDGAVRKEQLIWRELIRRFGGESVIWRDPSEAEAYLRGKVS